MGLWHPERTRGARRPLRRYVPLAGFVVLALALSGCGTDSELERVGMPEIVTEQGQANVGLWQGAWIAALATGVVVWALIIGAVVWFRRRSDDEVPVQTRYNLPVEIFYTVFPIIMVIVFFSHTVRVQNVMLEMDPNPDVTVTVVGQKWTWTFNHPYEDGYVYVAGDMNSEEGDIPTLVIPADQTVQFDLESPDVIHDFGIPAFSMRMDVIPGRDNAFQVTPTETGGPFAGKCYELCGAYHSRMLFQVEIVTPEEYDAYLDTLAEDPDNFSEELVVGGDYAGSDYLNRDDIDTEGEGSHQ